MNKTMISVNHAVDQVQSGNTAAILVPETMTVSGRGFGRVERMRKLNADMKVFKFESGGAVRILPARPDERPLRGCNVVGFIHDDIIYAPSRALLRYYGVTRCLPLFVPCAANIELHNRIERSSK